MVGILIWLMEEKVWNRPKKEHIYNIFEVVYDVYLSLFFTNIINLKQVSSRIILWFFWFNILIFTIIY